MSRDKCSRELKMQIINDFNRGKNKFQSLKSTTLTDLLYPDF